MACGKLVRLEGLLEMVGILDGDSEYGIEARRGGRLEQGGKGGSDGRLVGIESSRRRAERS